jgi:hypothetical protein
MPFVALDVHDRNVSCIVRCFLGYDRRPVFLWPALEVKSIKRKLYCHDLMVWLIKRRGGFGLDTRFDTHRLQYFITIYSLALSTILICSLYIAIAISQLQSTVHYTCAWSSPSAAPHQSPGTSLQPRTFPFLWFLSPSHSHRNSQFAFHFQLVVKALGYKPEGNGSETQWGEILNVPNPSGRTWPWGLLSP